MQICKYRLIICLLNELIPYQFIETMTRCYASEVTSVTTCISFIQLLTFSLNSKNSFKQIFKIFVTSNPPLLKKQIINYPIYIIEVTKDKNTGFTEEKKSFLHSNVVIFYKVGCFWRDRERVDKEGTLKGICFKWGGRSLSHFISLTKIH